MRRILHTALLFPVLAGAASAQRVARTPPEQRGVDAVIESLEAAQMRFFYLWRLAFQQSDSMGMGGLLRAADPAFMRRSTDSISVAALAIQRVREAYAHCNYNGRGHGLFYAIPRDRFVEGEDPHITFCPSWQLAPGSTEYDARTDIDAGIADRFRRAIRTARDSLIAEHSRAFDTVPENEWIAGQFVRYLVDRRSFDEALAAMRECRASASWCALLTGYVLASADSQAAADSVFSVALSAMPTSDRCVWNDLAVLLQPGERPEYERATCAQRDSLNRVLWWLSDPLYIEPANARRVEHFSRRVNALLRSAIRRDERYPWQPSRGAAAHVEMLVRYGRPSFNWWAWEFTWPGLDFSTFYLNGINGSSYASFEYFGERMHPIPLWSAVKAPLAAVRTDWDINDPKGPISRASFRDDALPRAIERIHVRVSSWWPEEHYRPPSFISQLPEGQVGFLRRDREIFLATATEVTPEQSRRTEGAVVHATLLTTTHPDSFTTVAQADGRVGAPLVLHGMIPSRPALLAIEYGSGGDTTVAAGRTRFGIAPPPTLTMMASREQAISDLLMLRALGVDQAAPTDLARVLPTMLGSQRIERNSRMAVYWETYGFLPTDTVEVAVWVERNTPQGILRQFGIALNVARDLNTPVAITWTENGEPGRVRLIPAAVPVVARSVVLDTSALAAGAYWLDVVVRARGREPVRSRRAFEVPPR